VSGERVVNLRQERYDLYIGRPSLFGNPFRIGPDGTRKEVLERYEAHVRASPQIMAHIPMLRGLTLGCYCKPKACHGDVLLKILKEIDENA
jgi:hypothetical protein